MLAKSYDWLNIAFQPVVALWNHLHRLKNLRFEFPPVLSKLIWSCYYSGLKYPEVDQGLMLGKGYITSPVKSWKHIKSLLYTTIFGKGPFGSILGGIPSPIRWYGAFLAIKEKMEEISIGNMLVTKIFRLLSTSGHCISTCF